MGGLFKFKSMKIKASKELKNEYAVVVNNATVRFNMASE